MTGRLLRCIKEAKKIGLKNKYILDIGCSFGWFCQVAKDNGAKEVIGVDPDPRKLSLARNNVQGAKFVKSNAAPLPFVKNKFDLVTLFDVIEHVPKNTETKTFKEINRVLKPGGMLLISTPFDNWTAKITDPAWYLGHRHYSKESLIKMLTETNLKIISVKTYGGYWEIVAMSALYISKWVFKRPIPFEAWFDKRRKREFNKKGFTHLFIVAEKIK